jgi:hypothetical protein
LLRLTLEGSHDPVNFPRPLQQKLADAAGVDNYETLDALVRETAKRTYIHFKTIIADPASAVTASRDGQQTGDTEK